MSNKDENRALRESLLAKFREATDADKREAVDAFFGLRTVEGRTLSPRNMYLLLIQARQRGMTLGEIGGFAQWQRAGRTVRAGERCLWLCYPRIGKNDVGEDTVNGFSWGCVFDRSQTDVMTEEDRERAKNRRGEKTSVPSASVSSSINAILAAFRAA